MKKTAIKSFSILALAFLMIGGLFLFNPIGKKITKAEEIQEEVLSRVEGNSDSLWAQTFDTGTEYSLQKISLYGTQVYQIATATDLAFLAYMVGSGDETYQTGEFALTADIDLAGSLWTPIGTYSNPFKGSFYGQGYNIKNVTINEYSCDQRNHGTTSAIYSDAGIFGNVDGATICDVTVSSWQLNTANTSLRKIGALIGSMKGGTYVINCHDICNSKLKEDGSTFSAIGSSTTADSIYKSGVIINNQTNTPTKLLTKTDIDASITVDSSSNQPVYGYVGYYEITDEDGTFMIGDQRWNASNYGVLLNADLTLTGFGVARVYRGSKPVLREEATNSDVYPFKEGYKASFTDFEEADFTTALIKTVSFTKSSMQISLDYGYGTRSGSYSVGYDQSFASLFASSPKVLTRAGYDFDGMYTDNEFTQAVDATTAFPPQESAIPTFTYYKSCFPTPGQTYYLKWKASETTHSFSVYFAIAGDEGGNVTKDVYSKVVSYEEKIVDVPSGTKSFDISLGIGYQIGNIIDSDGNPIKRTKQATGLTYNTDLKADNVSGVYPNFSNHTGIGDYYTAGDTNTINNDDYALVSAWAQYKSGNAKEGITYTITVENICGSNGAVWIVIEREWLQVDFSIRYSASETKVDLHTDPQPTGTNIYYTNASENKRTSSGMVMTWYIRRGESPKFHLSTKASPVEGYILDWPGENSNHDFKSVSGEDDTAYSINGMTFYKYITFNLTDKGSTVVENNGIYSEYPELVPDKSVIIGIGSLETKISLRFEDTEGNLIENTDGTLGAYINENEDMLGNTEGILLQILGKDRYKVKSNGIYEASLLKVDGKTIGEFVDHAVEVNFRSYIADPGQLLHPYVHGTEGVNHEVVIVFDIRQYDLQFEFYFNDIKIEMKEGESFNTIGLSGHELISQITKTYENIDAGSALSLSFKLTDIGLGALTFKKVMLVNENGTDTGENNVYAGYILSKTKSTQNPEVANDGEGKYSIDLGSYETTLRVYFEYKYVMFAVNSLHIDGSLITDATNKGLMYEFGLGLLFNYSNDKGLTLGFEDANDAYSNISLHTKYYLLGWYLKNGEIVSTTTFHSFLTDSDFVDDIAKAGGTTNASSYEYYGVSAEVGLRQVKVSYNAGEAGNGRLYMSDKLNIATDNVYAGSVTYGQELQLSDKVFYNLGYSFNSWETENGTVTNLKYSISGGADAKSFSKFFDNSAIEIREWNYLVADASKDQNATKSTVITAKWDLIEYYVNIDNTNQTFLSIGDTIYYATDRSLKNGQAVYYISGNSDGVYGKKQDGYHVIGYSIEDGNKLEKLGANILYHLNPDNFLELIKSDNKFSVNTSQSPIKITTLREASPYLIYLDSSSEGYYTYAWDESKDSGDFGQLDATSGQISINVVFDSVPANLQNAIDAGALTITRTGYQVQGWAISSSGVQSALYDLSKPYSSARDIHIVPIWKKVEDSAYSTLVFMKDVAEVRNFYLGNSFNILEGGISGNNIDVSTTLEVGAMLTNGEKITEFGFIANGKTYSQQKILNYDWFKVAGNYGVKFYVTMTDSLNVLKDYPAESYTSQSGERTFTLVKNQIHFYDYNLHTIYTGTSEFVASEENNFGLFLYRYDWKGTDLASSAIKTAIGNTVDWFGGFSVASEDKNVGSGKDLKLTLLDSAFGEDNLSEIFSNVTKEGENYTTIISNLNIDKAKFVITFPEGSAYYINGVQVLVYDNSTNYTFSVGSTTFSYTFDKIMLHSGAQVGVYIGNENHSLDETNFIVYDLAISEHEQDRDTNFEWVISKESKFTLLSPETALQLVYEAKYLTSKEGVLSDSLADDYKGDKETLSITKLYIDSNAMTIPDMAQFTFSADNQVVIFVANQAREKIYVFINKEALSKHTLEFEVAPNLTSSRKAILKPLAWASANTSVTALEENFDTFTGEYTNTVKPAYSMQNSTNYIVLTDVVKAYVDYNSGENAGGESQEIIYISKNSAVIVTNPTNDYSGLVFNGYSLGAGTNITLASSINQYSFSVANGGKSETIKAKWLLNNINASLVKDKHQFKASTQGQTLELNKIANILLPDGVTNENYTLKRGEASYAYSSATRSFDISNDKGWIIPSMSGTFTLGITISYSDGVSEVQNKTLNLNFEVEITKNEIKLVHDNTKHLVYSNSRQESNVKLQYYINEEKVDDISLAQVPTANNSGSKFNFYVSSTQELLNADEYTISFAVDTNYADIFTIIVEEIAKIDNNIQNSIIVNIDKYTINIVKYSQQIASQMSKMFGSSDPTPLLISAIIEDNANDEVFISYQRQSGEAIGKYSVDNFRVYGAKVSNYAVDATDAQLYFEITKPGGNLKVEFADTFSYVYNGYAVEGFELNYAQDKYLLTAKFNETLGIADIQVEIDIYFESGANKVQIPEEEKQAYANKIEFASGCGADVGEYAITASLTEVAGEEWTGVQIVNTSLAKVVVTKRNLTVTEIVKVFDQTNSFKYNTFNHAENTCQITLENIVDINGVYDEVEIQGTIASENVGMQEISSIKITTNDNYNLVVSTGLKVKVIASQEEVLSSFAEKNNVEYGKISSNTTIEEIINLLPIKFNDGKIAGQYIGITAYEVVSSRYSTGKYLNAGEYTFNFTLTSKNYTFGADRAESLENVYSITVQLDVEIDVKAISITNGSTKITKVYDGNDNVLSAFFNQKVNESGIYASSAIMAGDNLTVVFAKYANKLIGVDKALVDVVVEGDKDNYDITFNIKGDITNVNLVFNKNGASQEFVDGEKEFGNTAPIQLTYAGDLSAMISNITNSKNYMTRVGYTQVGYSFNGEDIARMTGQEREDFLQSAVDGGASGITIDAIWEIDTYTLAFAGEHSTIYINAVETTIITLDYYASIDIEVIADIGYTFEGFTLSEKSAINRLTISSGLSTRFASLRLENILADLTITINTEEIEVKVVVDYNEPVGFVVVSETQGWVNVRERQLKYSELISSDLPVLKVTQEHTYDFANWTLVGRVSTGENIWERINGDGLVQDYIDEGYTFIANWEASELTLTLLTDNYLSIEVKKGEQALTPNGENYLIHYNDTISVAITADDWYKWKEFNITGSATIDGDNTATNKKTGAFVLASIKTDITLQLFGDYIEVEFTTSYDALEGTSHHQESGDITGVYKHGLYGQLDAILYPYSVSEGTYYQDKWTYGQTDVALTSDIEQFILSINGSVPTEDMTIALKAHFVGETYIVTFDKGNEEGAVFVENNSAQTISRQYVYGQAMTSLPVIEKEGRQYIYKDEDGKSFKEGQKLISSCANSALKITLTANWDYITYLLTVEFGENADKISAVKFKGDSYYSGDTIDVVYGEDLQFNVELSTGYSVDPNTTRVFSDFASVTLPGYGTNVVVDTFSNNVYVYRLRGNATLVFGAIAKEYRIDIVRTSYESISQTNFTVSYDQDISTLFNSVVFTRGGYKLAGLYHGTEVFASYSQGWTYNTQYVSNGIYKYDNDLSLTVKWEYDEEAKYVQATTSVASGLYYNAQTQTIATSAFAVDGGQIFAVGTTFTNGQKVKEVYYMLDGVKVVGESDFTLKYVNAISAKVYIVAVIEDTLSGLTHEVASIEKEAVINKTDVNIVGAVFESYYNETSAINQTKNTDFGELYFHDGSTKNEELAISKVEIIDENKEYIVGQDYQVKYYFSYNTAFKADNYTGIVKEGGYYTLTTADMTNKVYADIIKTPVTISFEGQGYFNSLKHKVASFETTLPEFAKTFDADITSITTHSSEIKKYTLAEEFVIEGKVLNSKGLDKTSNFEFVIDGSYEIVSTENAFRVDYSTRYLNLDGEPSLEKLASESLSIASFNYGGQTIVVNDSTMSYSYSGKLILTITNNGNDGQFVFVTNGESVSFNLTLSASAPALVTTVDWTVNSHVNDIVDILETLASEGSRSISLAPNKETTYLAIVTDYRAIKMSLGDKGGDQGYLYIKKGSNASLSTPEVWTGFEFTYWEVGQNTTNVTISSNTISVDGNSEIVAGEIVAKWQLVAPTATGKTFAFDAKVAVDATQTVALENILVSGIENKNDVISYAYSFSRNGEEIATGESFFVPANTTSVGKYTLSITASYLGYEVKSSSVEFNLQVNRLGLDSMHLSGDNFTYANMDYTSSITVTFTGAVEGEYSLGSLLVSEGKSYYMTLSGKSSTEIKLAGDYTLTLHVDETIFDTASFAEGFEMTKSVKVNVANVLITQLDVPIAKASKLYMEVDPDFTITKNIYDETITFVLTREKGEDCGEYAFNNVTWENVNYNLTIEEGTVFTITQSNLTLKVRIDSKLTNVYSKTQPDFVVAYNEGLGKWTVSLGASVSALTLTYVKENTEFVLSGTLYRHALERVDFIAPSAINAGSYSGEDISASVNGTGNFLAYEITGEFTITKLGVNITKVEKVFDRNDNILESGVMFAGILAGDTISLSGKYNSPLAGEDIGLVNLKLTGASAGNYEISNPGFKGKITPAQVGEISFALTKTAYTYGQLSKNTNISELIKDGYTFVNGGVSKDIESGFISLSSFTVEEKHLSTSDHFKVGDIEIKFILTSANFTGLSASGYSVVLKICAKELNLSSLNIVKEYDETALLPSTLNVSLIGYALEGDLVAIDLTKSGYENAGIGENKKVTIVLTGADSANYTVKDNVKGTITSYVITFNVIADFEHDDLVTNGAFVDDNEDVRVIENSFKLYYPSTKTAVETLKILTYPTRKGYSAESWKFFDGSQYVKITENNIVSLLKSIAEDKSNQDRAINIYTSWTIQYYNIEIEGLNVDNYIITKTEGLVEGNPEQGYYANYFSSFEMEVNTNRGYKIQTVNIAQGSVGASNLVDIGKNAGKFTFEKVESQLEIEILTQNIGVTFNIEFNAPLYTLRTDANSLSSNFAYVDLASKTQKDLPALTVTEGTYTLNGFVYGEANKAIASKTLQAVVDELYPQLTQDVTIKLIATWKGVDYVVKFDANGGSLTGSNQISAVYGQAITESFPTANMVGMTNTWVSGGKTYAQNDVLQTVGEKEGDNWTVVFKAVWTYEPYTLTVKFDEKLKVFANNEDIVSGQTFTLIYKQTQVVFTVEANEGYVYEYLTEKLNGEAVEEGISIIVKNLTADGEITFASVADDNLLTIVTENVDKVEGYIVTDKGDEPVEIKDDVLVAKTESKAKVVFTAKKGWAFADTSAVFVGNGNYSVSLSADKKTLIVAWTDFVGDAILTVKAQPDDNIITTGDLTQIFESLAFNGKTINLEGDSFTIKTGTALNVVGAVKYGYKNGKIVNCDGSIVSENSSFSTSDRHYHYSAVIDSFDENFTMTFTNEAREFSFELSVENGQEAYGRVTSQANQTVKYGEALVLEQAELLTTFKFDKWTFGEDKSINFAGNGNLVLSKEYFEMLESVNEGETIQLKATYVRKITLVKFSALGKGAYTVTQEAEGVKFKVGGGMEVEENVYMSQYIDFLVQPNTGYEISKLLVNGEEKNAVEDYGYDVATGKMAIYIELESSITSIAIEFTASKAKVYVQAGMRVNYDDYFGTNKGGNIYMTDSTGLLLGEEHYKEGKSGNIVIGADYSVDTYTDTTLFFVIEVKSGFTMAVSASAGVLINEYQSANGKVYSFANVKDGSEINVIFTAKENVVKIKFALEGQTDLAHAGIITVDTSSNFVSAVPNRGDNLSVSIITGEKLVLGVNSSLAYKLATDDYGNLKYSISYPDENQFETSQIAVGEVIDSDSIKTGYTNSANFTVSNVTTSATIIFYVTPREYTIEFNLFDNITVVMKEKVRYGESWSTNLMTAEEKAEAFASRTGYTFLGYYTLPNGQGTKYIDQSMKVVSDWLEDGYSFNGSIYLPEENFDVQTSTFTLYASWLFNRAEITVSILPVEVLGEENKYSISNVITNINTFPAWIGEENKWYAEIQIGASLQIKAINFAGYEFVNWLVSFEGGLEYERPASFTLPNIEMGSYLLKAIYQPTFSLDVANQNNSRKDGGKVELLQNGGVVLGTSFDCNQTVTLKATPNEGYRFLYFVDNFTGKTIAGNIDARGVATYTYPKLQKSQISITAVFTGKDISVNLNTDEIQLYHNLISVKVNGKNVNFNNVISAKVGDSIEVIIAKSRGYGFEVSGAEFTYILDNSRNYVFSHTFVVGELTSVSASAYSIDITFTAPREKIRFAFVTDLFDAVSDAEVGKVGRLIIADSQGNETESKIGSFYTVLYGDTITLIIKPNEFYSLSYVLLENTQMIYDITSSVVNNTVVIDEGMMNTYFDYEIIVQVTFARLLWTEVRSSAFLGYGTKSRPYIISTEADFARLSYLVNNVMTNEDGVLYSECYYKVTNDLDFSGRYFEPIGTEYNPFNGTIDLGSYEFKNVAHYRNYTNPRPSYSGLFWHLGKKAKIIQENNLWITILIIVGVVVLVVGLILLLLFIRKRKKKKLDDFAGQDALE